MTYIMNPFQPGISHNDLIQDMAENKKMIDFLLMISSISAYRHKDI